VIIHQPIRRHRPFSRAAFGGLGGDALAESLGRVLDDGYHYLRGVPAGGEVLDTIVVGRGGTWAISRADESGRFRKRNGHWYRWHRGTESWVPWAAEPIDAARMAGHRLSLVLERAGVPSAVEPCLLSGHGMVVEWEPDQRPGIHVHADPDRLAARVVRDDALTQPQVDRIVVLLDPREPLHRLAPEPEAR
jgi:hypothetical protein